MNLIEEYPLNVNFPNLIGSFKALSWWTHDLQHALILAKTEPALIKTFEAILKVRSDAQPKKCFNLEIVSPTEELKLTHATIAHENERGNFKFFIKSTALELHEAGLLPKSVKICNNYKINPESELAQDPDDYWEKYHDSCINCNDSFVLDIEELYLAKRFLYREKEGRTARGAPSKAPPPNPDMKIFAASPDFGDHGNGTTLVLADKCSLYNVNFYCHADIVPIPQKLLDVQATLLSAQKELKKKKADEYKEHLLQGQRKRLEPKLEFFK
jgi:hypothetical protein